MRIDVEPQRSAIARLSRRLSWVGTALLLGAVASFVWAIGFTTGVDGLIDGLIVTSVGFLVPGLVVYWVAWFVGSADADERLRFASPARRLDATAVPARRALLRRAVPYGAAVVAALAAWLMRSWLSIYLGVGIPFATFFLAAAFSAWYGGIGPGIVATLIGLAASWYSFVGAPGSFALTGAGDVVALGLYLATALCIVGLTSGLVAARTQVANLLQQRAQRVDEDAATTLARDAVAQTPAMLWMIDVDGKPVFANPALMRFVDARDAAGAWSACATRLHPDDRDAVQGALAAAIASRVPASCSLRLLRHDGVYRLLALEVRPRYDAAGRYTGYAGSMLELASNDDTRPALSVVERP